MTELSEKQINLIIRQQLTARDWRLVSPENLAAFCAATVVTARAWDERASSVLSQVLVERAVIAQYSHLLWESLGKNGTFQQERALVEILAFITPIIRRMTSDEDVAQDIVNEALLTIWTQHEQVRDPHSFLHWAAITTRHAAMRATRRPFSIPFTDLFSDSPEEQENLDRLLFQPATEQFQALRKAATNTETEAELRAVIQRCLARTRLGAEVAIAVLLDDKSVAEVSKILGITAANAYVILKRARAKLRKCPELLEILKNP